MIIIGERIQQQKNKGENTMKTPKNYYAIIDTYQEGKGEYGHGFCNMKSAVAFASKKERDDYLAATYDLSARPCTRVDAMRYAEPIYGDRYAYGLGVEMRPVVGDYPEYAKLRD